MSIKRPWMVAFVFVACCYGSLALAELTPVDPRTRQDIVFQILGEIAQRVTGWEAQVTSAASYLFWTLGTISLSWTMGMLILKRADLGEFFSELIRFIFFFGLFYALLRQGPTIARLILESMLQLGQETAGSTIKYQTFMDIGTELLSRADQFQQSGASEKDSNLVLGLCGGIVLMLTTMVINLFLVFVAGWFLMYAGIFFLGFGGARWTTDIAMGYYKAVIAVGIQMFVMALIMGIATDVLGGFFDKFSFDLRFYELMTFLVATFAFMTIFNRIPTLLSGLISGASIGTSPGELGGALRGTGGVDPLSAGRAALGTAVGGAQKIAAAMRMGAPDGRIQTSDSLITFPEPKREKRPDTPSGLGSGRDTMVAQRESRQNSVGGSTGGLGGSSVDAQLRATTRDQANSRPGELDESIPGDRDGTAKVAMASIGREGQSATANAADPSRATQAAELQLNNPDAVSPANSPPSQALAQNAKPPTTTPGTESSGAATTPGTSGGEQKGRQNPPDARLASGTPSSVSLHQDAVDSESASILKS